MKIENVIPINDSYVGCITGPEGERLLYTRGGTHVLAYNKEDPALAVSNGFECIGAVTINMETKLLFSTGHSYYTPKVSSEELFVLRSALRDEELIKDLYIMNEEVFCLTVMRGSSLARLYKIRSPSRLEELWSDDRTQFFRAFHTHRGVMICSCARDFQSSVHFGQVDENGKIVTRNVYEVGRTSDFIVHEGILYIVSVPYNKQSQPMITAISVDDLLVRWQLVLPLDYSAFRRIGKSLYIGSRSKVVELGPYGIEREYVVMKRYLRDQRSYRCISANDDFLLGAENGSELALFERRSGKLVSCWRVEKHIVAPAIFLQHHFVVPTADKELLVYELPALT